MNRILLAAAVAASIGIAGVAQAAGDAAAGKADATSCAMCHGPDGQGTKVGPKIAGMAPAAFVQALGQIKAGSLGNNPMMKAQAERLGPQQEQDLAAYYASLK